MPAVCAAWLRIGKQLLLLVVVCICKNKQRQTCSELFEEPHAGAEELVGAAEVTEVGSAEGEEEPQQGQVSLQHWLCQGCSDDQIAYTEQTVLSCYRVASAMMQVQQLLMEAAGAAAVKQLMKKLVTTTGRKLVKR